MGEGSGGNGSNGQFSGWDWAVFVIALVLSLGTGVAAGWISRRNARKADDTSTAAEFLMGGRAMNPLAVALSTMIGVISSVTVLGNPAEMYSHGTQLWMNLFGVALGFVFVHLVNLTVFYPLKIISVYTYIERRFQSKGLRAFSVYTTFVANFFYIGLCVYTPSLAMETVTGLPAWVSIIIMGVVCTTYSSWGGVRAVVYTDILQVFVMMGGVVVIIATAVVEVGGLGRVWDIAWDHGRVELFNIDPSPLQRHSLWLVTIQGYFSTILLFGMGQPQVQRICSVSTWKKAVGAHYLNLATLVTVLCLCNFMGIAVFAVYADCDPMATEDIEKPDQIVPFYVIDRLSRLPGLPGLFVAALFGSGLSSYSSQINSVAAVLWEDFFKNSKWVAAMREDRRRYVNVVVTVIAGMAGIMAGIISMWVRGVFQAGQLILGTINSPQFGLFMLGMMCPFANAIGGVVGMVVAFAFNLWITLGAMFSGVAAPYLDFSDEGCNATTSTATDIPFSSDSSWFSLSSVFSSSTLSPFASTTESPEDPDVFPLYLLSYTLYFFCGVSITVFVGSVVSLLTNPWSTERAGKIYLHPTFYALQRGWERRRAPQDPHSINTQNLVQLKKY
ncbi:sodium-coupled monocarboxylate transporter 1-like [Eriocheir sinensis]|uniref:sodium-coupled monocarboxylate transporter 1-like n=1 Tax=Eriocheir sinensis TaxID=95602 RepID=UPI0021CA7287|nr:sodium-coupled monocarboxylate transporter 1-like [Eriocheir sinensis]